jgi:molybdopterin converting factor subunit 1
MASEPAPIRVCVRLFAVAKQKAGRAEIDVTLSRPATVGDLRRALAAQYPVLASLAASVLIAVDSEYASDSTAVVPGSRVALIPPVSGGGGSL